MIPRKLQAVILQDLKHFPSVCILGPRQVGKTTLVKSIAKSLRKDCIYLDLENPIDQRKMADAFTFLSDHQSQVVILDEIQAMPALFSVLRSAIDAKRKPGRFILLGSASPALLKGVSESLAGRNIYLELAPLNLLELKNKVDMKRHWLRGGFPSAVLARSQSACWAWLHAFTRNYIERDLALIFGVDFTVSLTRRLLSMLAHVHGQIWNAEMIGRSLGVTSPTVNRYVDYLEGAYLIHRLPAFAFNTRKRLVKAPKVYIRDTGVLHEINGIQNLAALLGHPVAGLSWEGYVIEQIIQGLSSDLSAYFYRTQAGAECDLVLVKGILPLACIEIKLSNAPTLSKGYYQCIEDLKTIQNYVIVPDVESYRTGEKIWVCNLMDFLQNRLRSIK